MNVINGNGGTNITTGSFNTGLTGNYALGQSAGELFSYPAVAAGTAMLTSKNAAVRGLGAGLAYTGSTLGAGAAKGIANAGVLSSGKDVVGAAKSGIGSMFKGTAGASFGMGAAGAVLGAVAGPKQEYSGEKGSITKGLDSVYDGVSAAVNFIPGFGLVASGIMLLGKGVGAVANRLGGGTDAMTTLDAVLGSSFFNLTPMGLINGFGGKKAHTMEGRDFMTQENLNNVWSGYGGTYSSYQDALSKQGKKYGKFSSGARKKANALIDKANMDRADLLEMNRNREIGSIKGEAMYNIRASAYDQSLTGGINSNRLQMGRKGIKILDILRAKRITNKRVPKRLLPKNVELLIEHVNPYKEYLSDYVPFKELNGGTLESFKNGGSVNIIPEGNLHARLHHMENADNLTKKGIPVVDNNGNQLAEIELNEIIFRKEVTDKLEELAKDGSDEAAIEAGKLLVEEIFENTDDRTGLIKEVISAKNGSKIILKAETGVTVPQVANVAGSNNSFTIDTTKILEAMGLLNNQNVLNYILNYNSKIDNWTNFLNGITSSIKSGVEQLLEDAKKRKEEKERKKLENAAFIQSLLEKELWHSFKKDLVDSYELYLNLLRSELYNLNKL